MRRALVGITILIGTGAAVAPVQAGLYNSQEQRPPLSFQQASLFLRELREIPVPGKPGMNRPLRDNTIRQTEYLEGQLRSSNLSMSERAELGACYIRLGRVKEARRVLEAGDQNNSFLIQANLATAYFVSGPGADPDLRRAVGYQQLALRAWTAKQERAEWAGWGREQRTWARRVELLYLKLLQSRLKESLLARPGRDRGIPLDPLFPEVALVDPKRPYLPGELPPRVADQLPPNALHLVWDLALCAPGDMRLLWLLAELLNANGEVEAAHDLMEDIAKQGVASSYDGLVRHRQVLARSKNAAKAWRDKRTQTALLTALSPRGLLTMPGAGPIAQDAGAHAPEVLLPVLEQRWFPPQPAPPKAPDAPVGGFTWRHITVGFVSGFLIAALVGMQFQEWRRRRQAQPPQPPSPSPEADAPPGELQSASSDAIRPAGGA